MIRTGRSNAAAKSNPTQPGPRFTGSERGPCAPVSPGYPTDTASKVQSLHSRSAAFTIRCGVRVPPEAILRASEWPVASILTLVPPTSTTRMLEGGAASRCRAPAALARRLPALLSGSAWDARRVMSVVACPWVHSLGRFEGKCRHSRRCARLLRDAISRGPGAGGLEVAPGVVKHPRCLPVGGPGCNSVRPRKSSVPGDERIRGWSGEISAQPPGPGATLTVRR